MALFLYQIIPAFFIINKDPINFPEPEKFDPYRFIDPKDGKFMGEGKMFKFGLGKRRCAGETFAKTTLFIFLTSLVQEFEFVFADSQSKVIGDNHGDINQIKMIAINRNL